MTPPDFPALPDGYVARRELSSGRGLVVLEADRGGEHVVLRLDPGSAPEARVELAVLSAVQHPGLARLVDFGPLSDREGSFVAREWIDGVPLSSWDGRTDPTRVGSIVAGLCAPLEALHAAGFVHGDLKPDNILVRADGTPVLIDHGLARIAGTAGVVAGSAHYIAPEVLRGEAPDAAADRFALGVLLVELLVGLSVDAEDFYGRFPADGFLDAARVRPDQLPEFARDLVVDLVRRDPRARPSSTIGVGRSLASRLSLQWTAVGDEAPPPWPVWAGRGAFLDAHLPRIQGLEAWTLPAQEDHAALAQAAALRATLAGSPARRLALDHEAASLGDGRARELWARRQAASSARSILFVHGSDAPAAREALRWLTRAAQAAPGARLVWIGTTLPDDLQRVYQPHAVPTPEEAGLRAVLVEILGEDPRLETLAERFHAECGGTSRAADRLWSGLEEAGWLRREPEGWRLRRGALPDWLGRSRATERTLAGDPARLALAIAWLGDADVADQAAATGLKPVALAAARSTLVATGALERVTAAIGLRERWTGAWPELDSTTRKELHGSVAERLLARSAPVQHLCAHRWACGAVSGDELVDVVRRLGEQGAPDLGLDLAQRSLAFAEGLARAGDESVHEALGLALALTGDAARAEEQAATLTGAARARVLGAAARSNQRFGEAREQFLAGGPRAAEDALLMEAQQAYDMRDGVALDQLAKRLEALSDVRRGVRANVGLLRAAHEVRAGSIDEARAQLDAAADEAQAAGEQGILAAVEINRGVVARRVGDISTAREHLENARDLHEEVGQLAGVAQALALLGNLARDAGELAEAEERLARSLELRLLLGNSGGAVLVRGALALVAADRGHVLRALAALESEHDLVEAAGRREESMLLAARAEEERARLGRPAREVASRAELEAEPRAGLALARASWCRGEPEAARSLAEAAALSAARLARLPVEGEARWLMARIDGRADAPLPSRRGAAQDAALETALLTPDSDALPDLARELEACGRDDRAARAWLALAFRGDSAASTRAQACLGRCTAGASADEAIQITRTLVSRPDPTPEELDALGADETLDMDALKLLEINEHLVNQDDLPGLLRMIVEHAVELSGAERGFLVLDEDGQFSLDLAMDSSCGPVELPEVEVSYSVLRRALEEGRALRLSEASDDPFVGEAQSVANLELRSILAAPFRVESGLAGVIYLDHRSRPGAFDERTERLMGLLAGQAALAIRQVRRLQRIRALKGRLEEEVVDRDTRLVVSERALVRAGLTAPVGGLVGESEPMRAVHELLRKVAPAELAVLVTGESGTGKELAARALHELSHRKDGPFVAENCAAIPATLMESELFGRVRGAYTGADTDAPGLFERASGGTLFLDEVGELPLELQAKLLRALETRRIRRVGGEKEIMVDFRLVTATNRDLAAEVEAGRFRSDLMYRLDAVRLALPALEERLGDLPLLVDHFLRLEEKRDGRERRCSTAVLQRLMERAWPGNVRELGNEVARLCVLSNGDLTDPELVRVPGAAQATRPQGALITMAELERQAILDALERTEGDKRRAAELLGISRAKIYQRLKEWREE